MRGLFCNVVGSASAWPMQQLDDHRFNFIIAIAQLQIGKCTDKLIKSRPKIYISDIDSQANLCYHFNGRPIIIAKKENL